MKCMGVNLDFFNGLCLKTKISAICFVLGKMSFLPTILFLFNKQMDYALISIYVYAFLIASSFILSLIASNSKKIDTSILTEKINNVKDEDVFTVIVKDGKIISIN